MSTSWGYHEYTGGVFSTLEGYHEYFQGCSVHQRDTMSISEGYHEYIGGYHEYIGGYHEYIGGYHEYIKGYHEYIRDVQYIGFSIEIERILSTCSPTCIMISP